MAGSRLQAGCKIWVAESDMALHRACVAPFAESQSPSLDGQGGRRMATLEDGTICPLCVACTISRGGPASPSLSSRVCWNVPWSFRRIRVSSLYQAYPSGRTSMPPSALPRNAETNRAVVCTHSVVGELITLLFSSRRGVVVVDGTPSEWACDILHGGVFGNLIVPPPNRQL
ncbi:unnamed protein product [Ostreobium quekettii]|uniref:Uncharacterized protein n=1 Tax=Ostreobium quekettii TaxID=121088 RepID=A0A8S1J0B8_9CHLO|nr:unnamed protein product [Ostreobium quekettii]